MYIKKLIFAFCFLAPAMAFASSTLFTLSPYNGFVFGNFASTGSDFGGGIAAGGTVTIGNTSVAGGLLGEPLTDFTGGDTLVAGSTLTATSGTLYAGNVYGGGPSNNFTLTNNGGGTYKQGPSNPDPIDFSGQKTYYQNLSNALAGMS